MLPPHAAKVRIVTDEISELPALLHQVAAGETLDLLLKAAHAKQFAQYVTGVVEAQRLIEVRRQQVVFVRGSQCLPPRATARRPYQSPHGEQANCIARMVECF